MYQFPSSAFNKAGYIEKKDQSQLSNFDKVLTYIKAWDRSHGFKYCIGMGQIRSRLIAKFLKEKGIIQLPKIEQQFEIVFQSFDEFKLLLNSKHDNGTLNQWIDS